MGAWAQRPGTNLPGGMTQQEPQQQRFLIGQLHQSKFSKSSVSDFTSIFLKRPPGCLKNLYLDSLTQTLSFFLLGHVDVDRLNCTFEHTRLSFSTLKQLLITSTNFANNIYHSHLFSTTITTAMFIFFKTLGTQYKSTGANLPCRARGIRVEFVHTREECTGYLSNTVYRHFLFCKRPPSRYLHKQLWH